LQHKRIARMLAGGVQRTPAIFCAANYQLKGF